jgi:hypothetical protein
MSFNFNSAANLLKNLELRPFIAGLTQSPRGYTYSDAPWFLNDIGFAYANTIKYSVANNNHRIYQNGVNPKLTNTGDLASCNIGTFITQSQVSSVYPAVNVVPTIVSNPVIVETYVYFGCQDGRISRVDIQNNPPTYISTNTYIVEGFAINKAICQGANTDEIVYIESPDVSGSHALKYFNVTSNTKTEIARYTVGTFSTDMGYSYFRKDRLVSFTHPSLGFIICYLDFSVGFSDLYVYDSTYTEIIKTNVGYQWRYMKVSPNKKDLILWSDQGTALANIGRFVMDGGPTYSLTTISTYETRDLDFGYNYGGSPSNIYIISSNILNVWDVNNAKVNTKTDIYTFTYSGSDLSYLLTDSANDPSETNYLFFGQDFVGTSSFSNYGAGTMNNLYISTYSVATSSVQGIITSINSPTYDYTLGITCMRMIDGTDNSLAPKGHILQYYNTLSLPGYQFIGIFNTSRPKLSETVSTVATSLTGDLYDLVKFREDDVYLLIDQSRGEFQIIFWN